MNKLTGRHRTTYWIIVLLIAWAAFLALGTFLQGQDWRRALFVFVAVGSFGFIWLFAVGRLPK